MTAFRVFQFERGHRQKVGRGARVYKNRVFDPKPIIPSLFKLSDLWAVGKTGIICMKQRNDGVKVRPAEIISYQWIFHLNYRSAGRCSGGKQEYYGFESTLGGILMPKKSCTLFQKFSVVNSFKTKSRAFCASRSPSAGFFSKYNILSSKSSFESYAT